MDSPLNDLQLELPEPSELVTLRGFRKKWAVRSESAPSNVSGFSDFERVDESDVPLPELDEPLMSQPDESELESIPDFVEEPAPQILDPDDIEPSWKAIASETSSKRFRLNTEKLPWEHSALCGVFQPSNLSAGSILDGYSRALTPTHVGLRDVLHSTVVECRQELVDEMVPAEQTWTMNLKRSRRELPDEDLRGVALLKLQGIIMADLGATRLGCSLKHMAAAGNQESEIWQSFMDTFRMKASSTLHKRASSLVRLAKLLQLQGVNRPLRLTEEQLYEVICTLRRDGAGATSAQHLIESLYFLSGTVQFTAIDIQTTISIRCKGAARDLFLTKSPLEQKAPLRVDQVQWLESYILRATNVEACILGQLLFCIHSCSRWTDSQKIKQIEVEHGEVEVIYFAQTLTSKTTMSAEAKTRFLPFIGIGTGLNHEDWTAAWIKARAAENLTFGSIALPSYSERSQSWVQAPMSASEATFWLREFIQLKFAEVSLRVLGSHSCKCTLTTWAGRSCQVVFSPAERRLLGHHLEPGMRSVLVYSREAYTSLYSKVLLMINTIRDGTFDPDVSAARRVEGSLNYQPLETADANNLQADQSEDSDGSISSMASEMCVEDFMVDEFVEETHFKCFPGIPSSSLFVHRVSGIVHVVGEDSFAQCGRQLSKNFIEFGAFKGDPLQLDGCSQCLRMFQRKGA